MNKRRILVPIDLDSQSESALDFARNIATRLNAMISCMYVIEEQGFLASKSIISEAKLLQRRDAENRLSEKVNSILKKERNILFEIIVTSGDVHQKILEKSSDLNARLIIMGRSNSRGIGKNRIGSTTKHVIANSQVPVITTCNFNISNRGNIIVPLDLFKPIGKQISCTIETAILLGATVTVLSVIKKEMLRFRPACLNMLKEIWLLLKDNHVDCNTQLIVTQDPVSKEVLSISKKINSAMILLMINSAKRTAGFYMGSVSKEIITKSEVPVQCINPNFKSRHLLDESMEIINPNSLSWSSLNDRLINNQQELEA